MTVNQRFKIVKDETLCCYKIIDNTFNPEATKAIFPYDDTQNEELKQKSIAEGILCLLNGIVNGKINTEDEIVYLNNIITVLEAMYTQAEGNQKAFKGDDKNPTYIWSKGVKDGIGLSIDYLKDLKQR